MHALKQYEKTNEKKTGNYAIYMTKREKTALFNAKNTHSYASLIDY